MDNKPVKIDDLLYVVPRAKYPGAPGYMRVTKVGRVWLELAGGKMRVDKRTLAVDAGGYSPGYDVYRNEQQYNDIAEKERLRVAVRRAVEYTNATLSLEQVRAAARALGVE